MAPSSRDRLSVDLRGLKAALLDRSVALGVTPSGFVRQLLAEALGQAPMADADRPTKPPARPASARVRLCLRMGSDEARAVLEGAKRAGMSPGAYLAGLALNVPVLTAGGSRADHVATLVASSAELSTLSRNLHRLTTLLRQADAPAARQYRELLDTLAADVRGHLKLASGALADLKPQARRDGQAVAGGR